MGGTIPRRTRSSHCIFFGGLVVLVLVTLLRFNRIRKGGERSNKSIIKGYDVCCVADAFTNYQLKVDTYPPLEPVFVPNSGFQHLSSRLCDRIRRRGRKHQQRELSFWEKRVPFQKKKLDKMITGRHSTIEKLALSIVIFKAARTGSTFFTRVITNTLTVSTGRPNSLFLEPYCRAICHGPSRNSHHQENALRALLTNQCERNGKWTECRPQKNCHKLEPNEMGPPIFITDINPRFLNFMSMNFSRIFQGLTNLRMFLLRRTNFILAGYSKWHHGGCHTTTAYYASLMVKTTKRNKIVTPQNDNFTTQMLLKCIENYGLGEQELSSSIAFQASSSTRSSSNPFLVIYEDIIRQPMLVQEGVLQYLGFSTQHIITQNNNNISIFSEHTNVSKQHTGPFCDFLDVNCTLLKEELGSDHPCLSKQLDAVNRNLAWTVPLLSNGTMSIHGDCQPLKTLTRSQLIRTPFELYRFTTAQDHSEVH